MNLLVLGATSAIAQQVIRRYAEQGASLYLVARNTEKLDAVAQDAMVRGAAKVKCQSLDLTAVNELPATVQAAKAELQHFDLALIAQGTLPDQQQCNDDIEYWQEHWRANAESVIGSMNAVAAEFSGQSDGVIAVIGSVAGDRGRASNYAYGAAKAAVETYASGLRAQLFSDGIQVLLIKPGFVLSPMTQELDLPGPLVSSPEKVANIILKAVQKRKAMVYAPWYWGLIMFAVRWLPEPIFKRLNF